MVSEIREQKDLIKELLEEDKFTLIILDACRFDYFASEYVDFLKGRLIKAKSPASETIGWLNRCFPGHYNLTVISANPFINLKGFARWYDAKKHFSKIIDVWDWGWNDELSTVHPRKVNEAYELHTGKKTVVWYMQPHHPYIGETELMLPDPPNKDFLDSIRKMRVGFAELRDGIIPKNIPLFPTSIRRILDRFWKKKFEVGHRALDEAIKNGKIDVEKLRKAYRDNLRLALKYASEITNTAEGEVVICGDHGELLGEEGVFLHGRINAPELEEVPWFTPE